MARRRLAGCSRNEQPVVQNKLYLSQTARTRTAISEQPVARQVRIEVVLDLVAQVAAHEGQGGAGVEVGAAQHLAQIPLAPGLSHHVGLGEFLGAIGEVPAPVRPLLEFSKILGSSAAREI